VAEAAQGHAEEYLTMTIARSINPKNALTEPKFREPHPALHRTTRFVRALNSGCPPILDCVLKKAAFFFGNRWLNVGWAYSRVLAHHLPPAKDGGRVRPPCVLPKTTATPLLLSAAQDRLQLRCRSGMPWALPARQTCAPGFSKLEFKMNRSRLLAASLCIAMLAGCSTVYYGFWQKLGYEKRDILVDKVQSARDEQQDAKKQFQTTLQRFKEITQFNGGDLEEKYNTLSAEYDSCEKRAAAVTKKINSVDAVANDLFAEWEKELGEYTNEDLKRDSAQKLQETKDRYAQLLAAMRKSEATMKPVLAAFHDQVLYLKHNLDAAAIASLKDKSAEIDTDVTKLVADMEKSIDDANRFITQLQASK
jgi:hypothetical protein